MNVTSAGLIDIADMPGFNLDGPQNGAHSVSDGHVRYGYGRIGTLWTPQGERRIATAVMSAEALLTVCCAKHGAMNCMAKFDAGKLWRCITCNVGAFEPSHSISLPGPSSV